jgi:hypothetical protein
MIKGDRLISIRWLEFSDTVEGGYTKTSMILELFTFPNTILLFVGGSHCLLM